MKYSARLVTALAAVAVIVAIVVALTGFATTPDTDTATAASIQSTGIHVLPEGGGTALVLTNFDAAPETAAPITVTTIDLPTLHEGGGSYAVVGQFDTAIPDDLGTVHQASAAPLAITTIVMLAGLAVMRGGVAFFYSSVSTLTHWFVGLTRIMKRATTLFAYVSAGRTTRTTMPMHVTQHRHVAAVDTHYYIDDGDTAGFRRWLHWPTAKIADITARLQRTRHLPRLA